MEPKKRIIAPDSPGPDDIKEMLEAKVLEVFDGDGFLADIWHPIRGEWIHRVPFRFAFIDAPEMQQPFGDEAKEFLHQTIVGKVLRLDLVGKQRPDTCRLIVIGDFYAWHILLKTFRWVR